MTPKKTQLEEDLQLETIKEIETFINEQPTHEQLALWTVLGATWRIATEQSRTIFKMAALTVEEK